VDALASACLEIASLRSVDADALALVAGLHVRLLPHGIGQLGPGFLLDFLYRPGMRSSGLHVGLARIDEKPAGFVTFTTNASVYAGAGLTAQLPTAVMALSRSALRDPRVLRAAWQLLRRSGERADGVAPSVDAEILAFGVLPEYRSGQFVRSTGIRLSRALFDHAATRLLDMGHTQVQANVEADNLATLQFYRLLGGRFASMPSGHPLQRVTVDLRAIGSPTSS
jgi:ribosomal protein S18 acetylase RimI-like enzyme